MRDLLPLPSEEEREWVLHVDLDQFLAAVEVLRRPELAGRPVVVGGDGDPTRARQVVATASYEARAAGVHSGMPLRTAVRRCPDAVFLPLDRPAYEAASAEVMAALRSLHVVVEEWGWDEACVGVRTTDPVAFARLVQATVYERTSLRCAVGIGETRLQAKTATGFAKPGGVASLTRRSWLPVMGTEPVSAISGIGTRTAAATRRARHPHRRRPRRVRPSRARPSLWPDHRSVPAGAGDGRPRRALDRRAAPAARTKPRGHVRARPHRRSGDRRERAPARGGGHRIGRRSRTSHHARRCQGSHSDLLHPNEKRQARRADERRRPS